MEWQTVLGSALGTSPVAMLSFYWARQAWKKMEKVEEARATSEGLHQKELTRRDALHQEECARKDAQIAALQQARLDDLRAVMQLPAPKPPG